MNSRHLLLYGYALPVVASVLIALALALWKAPTPAMFHSFLRESTGPLFAVLAVVLTICAVFQVRIVVEDNPEVLAVLGGKGNVRQTFLSATKHQALLVGLCITAICIAATRKNVSPCFAGAELAALSLILIEAIAMTSNGLAYLRMREKIIVAADTNRRQKS